LLTLIKKYLAVLSSVGLHRNPCEIYWIFTTGEEQKIQHSSPSRQTDNHISKSIIGTDPPAALYLSSRHSREPHMAPTRPIIEYRQRLNPKTRTQFICWSVHFFLLIRLLNYTLTPRDQFQSYPDHSPERLCCIPRYHKIQQLSPSDEEV
jgi:hypothetical protein